MAAAGVSLLVFRRFNHPPILGYLLAGLIIGPFTLPSPLVKNPEIVRSVADLGLVILLFALGLEFGWTRIRQVGLRVVIIGAIEITVMITLGYEVGRLLGWSGPESLFLGCAMSISSSAVLAQVLRDQGRLQTGPGRLIVGILVVEDFAAVLLLAVLSAVATSGTATAADAGLLVGKLLLFAMAALVLGGLFARKITGFVGRFGSRETLLVTCLAMCFGLALIGETLGISAAAGAFLMGSVLGDTQHSDEIRRVTDPVRDMFAAIFFVSIGMLVDPSAIVQFIIPAVVITGVFVLGKIAIDSIATFLTGHDGKTSLAVGMGMPQIGEFSLAMVKVGVEGGAVGAFLYPAITATTAITSFLYPYVSRSSEGASNLLERRSPRLLREYFHSLSAMLSSLRAALRLRGQFAREMQRSGKVIFSNVGIIVLIIGVATALLRFTFTFANWVHLPESVVGLVVGGAALALCIPPVVMLVRTGRSLADRLSLYALRGRRRSGIWAQERLRVVLRDTFLIGAIILGIVVSLPLVSELLILGDLATPIPVLVLIGLVGLLVRAAFKVHAVLDETFARTFYDDDPLEPVEGEHHDD